MNGEKCTVNDTGQNLQIAFQINSGEFMYNSINLIHCSSNKNKNSMTCEGIKCMKLNSLKFLKWCII